MSIPIDPRTPILVGAGQVVHRADSLKDAREPVVLMSEAARLAAADGGLASVPAVDSVRVVSLITCNYGNAGQALAAELGLTPRETGTTTPGGNSPQSLVNLTATEIRDGAVEVVLLAGGEAWRSRSRAKAADVDLGWPARGEHPGGRIFGDDLQMAHQIEIDQGIYMPVQMYPMFESALRAELGRTPTEHLEVISELWSRFSKVAAANPHAWLRTERTAEDIRTVGPANRMIGLPYTKSMNSNNHVDMAAALIMCSVEAARRMGISQDRWIFLHAGVDAHEHAFVSNRWSFTHLPAVEIGGSTALDLAGIGIDDVGLVDLYSCFPVAVELGARSLGLSLDRQLTRTGGLSFAGGPWNNYVMHAIATMMSDLREQPGEMGLVWGNGGFTTKHAFGVYGTTPPANGFRHAYPQERIDALPRREAAAADDAAGPAVIAAYTVMHDRDGRPERAIAACLLPDGRRAWGTSGDRDLASAMCEGEWVGRTVTLLPDGGMSAT